MLKEMLTLTQTKKNKPLLRALIIILVALILVAIFVVWNNSRQQNNSQQPTQQSQTSQNESPTQPNTPSSQAPSSNPSNPTPQQNGELTTVTENEQYKISQYKNTNKYVITLYAIVNNPSQYATYKEQLHEYKQNALNYLKGQNIDTSKAEIQYDPSEASSL